MFNAPNTKKNQIAALVAIIVGLGVGFYMSISDKPKDKVGPSFTTSLHDMDNFSQELAGHIGLETGFDRDSAEAEIRGYFGTTASTGQIPIFQSKKLEDGTFEIVATRNGLRDDSVKNEQLIARFSNNILTDYGMRVKCYRAADPEAWTKELCP